LSGDIDTFEVFFRLALSVAKYYKRMEYRAAEKRTLLYPIRFIILAFRFSGGDNGKTG